MEKGKPRKIISDGLIVERTGKTMEDWFRILDKKGAKKKSHPEIFSLISEENGLKPLGLWNQNLLTTTYEWNRGLKERGQRDDGFEISISRTIKRPVNTLYDYWSDEKKRSTWLHEKDINIRKATLNKSLVISWKGDTSVRVELYAKDPDKSQMVIQHMKISDSKTAASLKTLWAEALDRLQSAFDK